MVEDLSYQNIEFGAGCGNFGQKYYPRCFITDIHDGSKCEINYIDFMYDAMQTPPLNWDERFEVVVMCNPYNYGFYPHDQGMQLLKNMAKILKNRGRIVLVGNDRNLYCRRTSIKKIVDEFNTHSPMQFEYRTNHLNSGQEYPDYIFYQMNGETPAYPKHITELFIQK